MRKTQKILSTLLSAVLLIFCVFSFTGCADNNTLTEEKVLGQLQDAGFTEAHIKKSDEYNYNNIYIDNDEDEYLHVSSNERNHITLRLDEDSDVKGILNAVIVNFDNTPNAEDNLLKKIYEGVEKNEVGNTRFQSSDKSYNCMAGLDDTKTYISYISLFT